MKAKVRVSNGSLSTELDLDWAAALAEVANLARDELGLGEDGWELFCADGTTMQNKLGRSLSELRERRICPRLEFELRPAPQPGA